MALMHVNHQHDSMIICVVACMYIKYMYNLNNHVGHEGKEREM